MISDWESDRVNHTSIDFHGVRGSTVVTCRSTSAAARAAQVVSLSGSPGRGRSPMKARWDRLGRPGLDRFGVTVTPGRQTVWLDEPDGPNRWTITV
jgi:hypothetical protein